jgi:hypothetical protein
VHEVLDVPVEELDVVVVVAVFAPPPQPSITPALAAAKSPITCLRLISFSTPSNAIVSPVKDTGPGAFLVKKEDAVRSVGFVGLRGLDDDFRREIARSWKCVEPCNLVRSLVVYS